MRCDNCKSKDTYVKEFVEEFKRDNKKVRVKVKGRFCKKCDWPIYDPKLDDAALRKANEAYDKKYGMGEQILELRNNYDLSQELFSKSIGCAKKTLISYEKGKSVPNDNYKILLNGLIDKPSMLKDLVESNKNQFTDRELKKIEKKLEIFLNENVSDYEDLSKISPYNGYTNLNKRKLYNMILYFSKEGVLKTKLLKELFYADFLCYKHTAASISGLEYVSITYGPVPDNFDTILSECFREKYIDIDVKYKGDYEYHEIKDLVGYDVLAFNENELKALETVKEYFKNFNSKEIADYSHEEKAYKETEFGQKIDYYYAIDLKDFD